MGPPGEFWMQAYIPKHISEHIGAKNQNSEFQYCWPRETWDLKSEEYSWKFRKDISYDMQYFKTADSSKIQLKQNLLFYMNSIWSDYLKTFPHCLNKGIT